MRRHLRGGPLGIFLQTPGKIVSPHRLSHGEAKKREQNWLQNIREHLKRYPRWHSKISKLDVQCLLSSGLFSVILKTCLL